MNRLKILVAFIFYMFARDIVRAQELSSNMLANEVEWYIKKIRPEVDELSHDVFLVKIVDQSSSNLCLTIGMVSDSVQLASLHDFNYYKTYGDNLVLFSFPGEFNYQKFEIRPILDRKMINRKFFHGVVFLSTYPASVCCYAKGKMERVFYENLEDVPEENRIYGRLPSGRFFLTDSLEMRKRFRSGNKSKER